MLRTTPDRSRRSLDDPMRIWRARDAYRAQTFWIAALVFLLTPVGWVILALFFGLLFGGCQDAPYKVSRTLFQLECNPQRVPGGQCVAVTKGPTHE